jgi:hypothetical protein
LAFLIISGRAVPAIFKADERLIIKEKKNREELASAKGRGSDKHPTGASGGCQLEACTGRNFRISPVQTRLPFGPTQPEPEVYRQTFFYSSPNCLQSSLIIVSFIPNYFNA